MANLYGFQDVAANDAGVTYTTLVMTVGAAGAVPSTLTRRQGITSVTHDSTGQYTINLSHSYVARLSEHGDILQATYNKAHATNVRLKTDNVSGTTPSVTIECRSDDGLGTLVDPTQGDILTFTLVTQRMPPV